MRTIVVAEQGTTVRADGKMLVVEQAGQTLKKLRTADVDQLVLMGRVELSSGAIALLARTEIDAVFLTVKGSYRARLVTRTSKNVVLRCRQWERAWDEPFVTELARAIVVGKLTHQRQTLLRAQRERKDDRIADALTRMRLLIDQAKQVGNVDSLRGFEGAGAALYFSQFGKLIRNPEFSFAGRNRRPPRDPVNAALSFSYALLLNTIETETLRCGLDPFRGYFHEPAHGRPSLVLDLMEEFRPLIDLFVLRLLNRRQLGPSDFDIKTGRSLEAVLADQEDGESEPAENDGEDAATADEHDAPFDGGSVPERAVYLGETGRRIVLAAYFKRMRERILYPPRRQRLELRQIAREQCYHLARVIQGEEPQYIPFLPR